MTVQSALELFRPKIHYISVTFRDVLLKIVKCECQPLFIAIYKVKLTPSIFHPSISDQFNSLFTPLFHWVANLALTYWPSWFAKTNQYRQ